MATIPVTISIENLAPENGTFLTPLWFGFHDGTFDTYDRGRPSSPGLERLAEDGTTDVISQEFDLAGFGTVQGAIVGPDGTAGPIDPGETATFTVELDTDDPGSAFFNYASMIIPSNDFLIANGNERAHPIVDGEGNFVGADFIITGSNVLDAGTEVNDEIPENTAFFGQQAPDTGVVENGVVTLAEGFIPGGNILSDPDFAAADFTAPGYEVARIRVFQAEEMNDPVSLAADLTPDQEVPPVTESEAMGMSSLTLNSTGDELEYSLTFSGLDFAALLDAEPKTPETDDDVTRIHIHNGIRGENGPVAFGLFDLVAPEAGGQDADDLNVVKNPDGSVTLSGIWEETDPALIPLSEFVGDIQNAEPGEDVPLYWNVHTEGFPGGEIRGQLFVPADDDEPGLPGDDNIEGGDGDELLQGGLGNDTVSGGLGSDRIEGNEGDDILRGDLNSRSPGGLNGGDDTLSGGSGDDRIGGKGGNDVLFGDEGEDTLWGDAGDDLLDGGLGNDLLFGGPGSDNFVLTPGYGTDVIADFEVGIDSLILAGSLSVEQLGMTQQGGGVEITLSETDEVLAMVSGVQVDDLSGSFV